MASIPAKTNWPGLSSSGKGHVHRPRHTPEKLAISVNGHVVPVRWITSNEFYGELPSSFLKDGNNRATFLLPVDNHSSGFGMAFDWIKFAPIESTD